MLLQTVVSWRISFNATRLEHMQTLDKNRVLSGNDERMSKVYNKLWYWTKISLPVSVT